jgi:hypothetical protein
MQFNLVYLSLCLTVAIYSQANTTTTTTTTNNNNNNDDDDDDWVDTEMSGLYFGNSAFSLKNISYMLT